MYEKNRYIHNDIDRHFCYGGLYCPYGSLSKMEKDGLISFQREEEKRKIYLITDLGKEVLELEMQRIDRLYRNMKEMK